MIERCWKSEIRKDLKEKRKACSLLMGFRIKWYLRINFSDLTLWTYLRMLILDALGIFQPKQIGFSEEKAAKSDNHLDLSIFHGLRMQKPCFPLPLEEMARCNECHKDWLS